MARSSRNLVRVPRGVGSSSSSSQLVCSRPVRRVSAGPGPAGGPDGRRGRPRRSPRRTPDGRQLGERGVPGVLDHGHAHRGEQRLAGEGDVAGRSACRRCRERCQVQAGRCSESPGSHSNRSPSISVQPHPATTKSMASQECRWIGGDDARVDLVRERVHGAGRAVAVRAHVDADAGAAGASGCIIDVLERDHGLLVLPPLLDERRRGASSGCGSA